MAEPWLAVFTKNAENPNYQAFLRGAERVASAQGARVTRHIPRQADDPVEQRPLPDWDAFVPA